MWNIFNNLATDAKFYCQLLYPDKITNLWRLMLVVLKSRGLWLLTFHRIAYISTVHKDYLSFGWWVARSIESVGKFRNALISKSELRGDCDIAVPAYLSDKGCIICGALSIGSGSIIHDHVTFGNTVGAGAKGRPRVGANVWIGPKCIISGPVTIGDGSTLLPGTHLTYSIPPRSVVKGIPARVIQLDFDNGLIRRTLMIVSDIPENDNV
jgi:serine acetyltransferase